MHHLCGVIKCGLEKGASQDFLAFPLTNKSQKLTVVRERVRSSTLSDPLN